MSSQPRERLGLSVHDVLTTTRSVRRRLDFDRPVDDELIRECLEYAVQAPTGSNRQGWRFVVVTDSEKRAGLADRRPFPRSDPVAGGGLGRGPRRR